MNKGFSLVELIVVIAIMAILVGVAVPVYTSYITKAEDNVEKQYVEEVERALGTAYVDLAADLTELEGSYTYSYGELKGKSIKIEGNTITLVATPEVTLTSTNCALVDILDNVFTLDADSEIELTFSLNANGNVTLTACSAEWYD